MIILFSGLSSRVATTTSYNHQRIGKLNGVIDDRVGHAKGNFNTLSLPRPFPAGYKHYIASIYWQHACTQTNTAINQVMVGPITVLRQCGQLHPQMPAEVQDLKELVATIPPYPLPAANVPKSGQSMPSKHHLANQGSHQLQQQRSTKLHPHCHRWKCAFL
jgi:hypothetical protein